MMRTSPTDIVQVSGIHQLTEDDHDHDHDDDDDDEEEDEEEDDSRPIGSGFGGHHIRQEFDKYGRLQGRSVEWLPVDVHTESAHSGGASCIHAVCLEETNPVDASHPSKRDQNERRS